MKSPDERLAYFAIGGTENYRTEDGRKMFLFRTFNGSVQLNQFGLDIEGNEAFADRRVWFNDLKQADAYVFMLRKKTDIDIARHALGLTIRNEEEP